MARAFRDLSPREVLSLAVEVERANARRFRAFADLFRGYDDEAGRKFEELEREEKDHERMLAEEFRQEFGRAPDAIEECDVQEVVEAVDLDDAEDMIFDAMNPRKVFDLTLRAEEGARAFYRRAAAEAADEKLRRLYERLADMENEHVAWAKQKLGLPRE